MLCIKVIELNTHFVRIANGLASGKAEEKYHIFPQSISIFFCYPYLFAFYFYTECMYGRAEGMLSGARGNMEKCFIHFIFFFSSFVWNVTNCK